MPQSVKSPSTYGESAYDSRHCVLCWIYGDSDDDVSRCYGEWEGLRAATFPDAKSGNVEFEGRFRKKSTRY